MLGGKLCGKLRKYLVGKRETQHGRRFAAMAQTHYYPEDKVHYIWDNELDPALTVAPGDTVVYHTREVSDGQITPDSTADALNTLDWDRLYPLAGPVAIDGAEPGDVVEVEVLDIHTEGWGWTAVIPGFGLLEEDFTEPYLKIFDLSSGLSCPPARSAATWTPATLRKAAGSSSLCTTPEPSSRAATRMPPRATA